MCCGGSGGSKSGGGGGASLPDNQQPGEVFREANKANEPKTLVYSGVPIHSKMSENQIEAATAAAGERGDYKAEMRKLVSAFKAAGMTPEKAPTENSQHRLTRLFRKFG